MKLVILAVLFASTMGIHINPVIPNKDAAELELKPPYTIGKVPDNWLTPQELQVNLDNQNQGSPFGSVKDPSLFQIKCSKEALEPSKKVFNTMEHALAVNFPNTTAFNAWIANAVALPPQPEKQAAIHYLYKLQPSSQKVDPEFSQCTMENGDHFETVEQVGPFITTGSYNWMLIEWDPFAEALKKHPKGIDLLSWSYILRDQDGNALTHPPLHNHHGGVGTEIPAAWRTPAAGPTGNADLWFRGRRSMQTAAISAVGDVQQCAEQLGGTDCATMATPPGYSHPVDNKELSLSSALINDVRAPNSPPLAYHLQFVYKWIPRTAQTKLKPISFVNLDQPRALVVGGRQIDYVDKYEAPVDKKGWMWYSGRMPTEGTMYKSVCHMHRASGAVEEFLFSAKPEDLGLTDAMPDKPWLQQDLKPGTNFSGFLTIKTMLYTNLKAAQDKYSKSVSKSGPPPRLICACTSTGEKMGGWDYERQSLTHCDQWTFKKGEIFTSVGFNREIKQTAAPGLGIELAKGTLPQHFHWHFWYTAADEKFHAQTIHGVQDYDVSFVETSSLYQCHLLNKGGTGGKNADFEDHVCVWKEFFKELWTNENLRTERRLFGASGLGGLFFLFGVALFVMKAKKKEGSVSSSF